jgi:anti-sigma B factor antagonist
MDSKAEVMPVKLGAELTIYQVAELYETLSAQLKRQGELQLDLSAVTEIDSAGIQLLLQLAGQSQRNNGTVTFLSPSSTMQQMMTLFRLNADFTAQQVQDCL